MRRLILTAFVLALAGAALAAKSARVIDKVWTHPQYDGFNVRAIAVLPPASYEHNFEVEKQAHAEWGRQFAGARYRWVSANTSRDLLRAAGGDSLLKAIDESVLSKGRIDSLMAPGLCAKLHTDAVLSVRVDNLAQVSIEPEQSGKPSTTVQLSAALVDTTGSLLWSISGSQTVEGAYVQSNVDMADRSGTAGTRSTGLHGAVSAGAPPAIVDVLDELFARWAPLFPGKTAPADTTKK